MASQQALQDRILKKSSTAFRKEVSAPYIKMATAIGIFMNRAVNMLSTSVNRHSAKSGMSGKHCSMPTSAQLIVSFIRWAEWRLRPITPLWRWQKIFFPDASTAFVFVIWKLVTGTRNCWITLNPALSGQMTLDFLLCTQASSYAAALSGLASRHRYASIARYTDLRRKRRYLLRQPA